MFVAFGYLGCDRGPLLPRCLAGMHMFNNNNQHQWQGYDHSSVAYALWSGWASFPSHSFPISSSASKCAAFPKLLSLQKMSRAGKLYTSEPSGGIWRLLDLLDTSRHHALLNAQASEALLPLQPCQDAQRPGDIFEAELDATSSNCKLGCAKWMRLVLRSHQKKRQLWRWWHSSPLSLETVLKKTTYGPPVTHPDSKGIAVLVLNYGVNPNSYSCSTSKAG